MATSQCTSGPAKVDGKTVILARIRRIFWRFDSSNAFNLLFRAFPNTISVLNNFKSPLSQVSRALVDAMAAGAASTDADYVVCVALASDSPDIVQLFQREFGDKLIHVDGPVVHIDRR
jgi:hypothetical protein